MPGASAVPAPQQLQQELHEAHDEGIRLQRVIDQLKTQVAEQSKATKFKGIHSEVGIIGSREGGWGAARPVSSLPAGMTSSWEKILEKQIQKVEEERAADSEMSTSA